MTRTLQKSPVTTIRGSAPRRVLGVAGEILITLGVVVLLFVGYDLWFTGLYTASAQRELKHELAITWQTATANPAPPPAPSAVPSPDGVLPDDVVPGNALALIRIPRLGRHYVYAIVEGVSTADLKKGPGHYPGTAMPGQVGNFVVSGHRTTYLAPFNGLDKLRLGDPIVIETATMWYIYRVTQMETVLPTDVAVILPVPDHPGERPTEALITLTTCTPKYSASHRLVVHGRLETAQPKSAGIPAVLREG
ncbi:MAG: class E sortase [Acidothermus cellulolyticus]|nr:class E sortase [Acidothermus cellulolyticus]